MRKYYIINNIIYSYNTQYLVELLYINRIETSYRK